MCDFIIFQDFGSLYSEFTAQMDAWIKTGKIYCREEIVDGPEQSPATFIGMLDGNNFGKCVIRISPAK